MELIQHAGFTSFSCEDGLYKRLAHSSFCSSHIFNKMINTKFTKIAIGMHVTVRLKGLSWLILIELGGVSGSAEL